MTTLAPAVRVLAALRSGAVLVARPHGVVHVHGGSLTRSGASVPSAETPFCGTRSRRLRVVGGADDVRTALCAGRRFCRSCTLRLPAALGVDSRRMPGPREEWVTAYAGLTVADLRVAARWCRSVDETHQVGRLLLMLHGPKPLRPDTDQERELRAAHDEVEDRRRRLTAAALTPEEREAQVARREMETAERRRIAEGRHRAEQFARATDRNVRGKYLMPHERELLATGT